MLTFIDDLHLETKGMAKMSTEDSDVLSKGFTPKSMMQDKNGHSYIAKSPDPLTTEEVFRGYVPLNEIDKSNPKTRAHIFSLEFEGAFIELLTPNLMKSLFGELLVVPEMFIHVGQNHQVIILSKLLNGFDEFLHQKVAQKFGTPLDNLEIPRRHQLDLSEQEAFLIGQLYAAALVFNHWDILNSKLLNSGKITIDEKAKACIVDFGFCGHLSYKGRHNDSLCLDDESFAKGKKINYRFFSNDYNHDYRHRFALPFDGLVGSLLPHTLVEDLFDLSGNDSISTMMRKGFASMIEKASHTIESNPNLYDEVFKSCLARFSKESIIQPKDLANWINMSYYSGTPGGDNLYTIITDRIHDCQRLLKEINQGADARSLHEKSRDNYVQRNSL
jgi:hypothetical protein